MTQPPYPPAAPPPPPPSPTGSTGGADNRTLMIALSYLWILAVIPLLVEKDDRDVQWHAKHGLVLMVAELFIWIVFSIVLGPLGVLGCIAALFSPLLMLGELILHVICIVKGINGQRLIIPGVSDFADKL